MASNVPPGLQIPEGWELKTPNDDPEKCVYQDVHGATYRPVRYLSDKQLAWGWLPIETGEQPAIVYPSLVPSSKTL